MITREVPACQNCPYKPVDLKLSQSSIIHGVKTSVMDIDFIWEVGKDFAMIAELKNYSNADSYNYFYMPANQFVCLKKLAAKLECDAYFIVQNGRRYYVHMIDINRKRYPLERFGKKSVLFSKAEFDVFTRKELADYMISKYVLGR